MATTHNYPAELPGVIRALGSEVFPTALLEFIQAAADFDSAVIMAYPQANALQVICNALHDGDQAGFGGAYVERLWLLSPLYLSAKAGVRGYFHILDIAPANFKDSEYYARYYHLNGVSDQTGFLVETGDGTPVVISLERTSALPAFSQGDKNKLSGVAATVAALVRQQWAAGISTQAIVPVEPMGTGLHFHVENLLERFGSSVLTPRERDVVQLVLKGHPSKTVALHLGISTQTEQVHRKNIYRKLGLSSHGELFSLFFDALVSHSPEGGDPLLSLSR